MTAPQKNNELPRLGFLGLGWIGQNRMQALVDDKACTVAAIADPSPEVRERVRPLVPDAAVAGTLDELLQHDLDGIVIATPSALHAQQALQALERGVAVFCQKPLARTQAENAAIVEAARKADRLLGVDLSYRHTEAMRRIRNAVVEGELGQVYAADLVFHNAYGPDKSWARDATLSGGGCAIDLGIHLVDLALWALERRGFDNIIARLHGEPVEQHAVAQLDEVRLACSWNLHAGRDAVIEATFYGSDGAVSVTNVDGSFYDFRCERFTGTQRETLVEPPDAWSGRAAVRWAERLAGGDRFDPAAEHLVDLHAVVDRIYG